MSTNDIMIYGKGPLACSVCAPADWTDMAVTAEVNRLNPPGGTLSWGVSSEPAFADGRPNPCPCEDYANRRHWLFEC